VSFAAITLCVSSRRVFIIVYFVIDSVRKLLDTSSYIHNSSGIRTHDPKVRTVQEHKRVAQRHWDWLNDYQNI
jgi:hypothetical protein